jgi:hypothetical protein
VAQGVAGGSKCSMSATPLLGRRRVTTTRTKQTNLTSYEENVLCKSWLEISGDAATNTG